MTGENFAVNWGTRGGVAQADAEALVEAFEFAWTEEVGVRAFPAPEGTDSYPEMDRVLPLQLAEWRRLRDAHPGIPLVVAGDLNMNLGGPHDYGTKRCRAEFRDGLRALGMTAATTADQVPAGALRYPPSDHVLVPASWSTRVVSAWEGTAPEGVHPSDHSGLVVEVAGPAERIGKMNPASRHPRT